MIAGFNTPMQFDGDLIIIDPCFVNSDILFNKESEKELNLHHFLCGNNGYGDGDTILYNDYGDVIGCVYCETMQYLVITLEDLLSYKPNFNMHITKPEWVTWIKDFHGMVELKKNYTVKNEMRDASGKLYTTYYETEIVGIGNVNFSGHPEHIKER